jgi:replication factor C large subunit
MRSWIHKYLPKKSSDIVGQDESVVKLKKFILDFKTQKKKAMIAYGPPGTGKTSSVHAIGNENNLEVIEVNASDFRNKDKVNSIIGAASKQMSLFAKSKVILVDEIDGLSGTKDRGGLLALIRIIKKTSFPMVLTAFDPYDRKYSKLRRICDLSFFDSLGYVDVFKKLSAICEKEGVKFEEMALKSIARRCGGDLRAAINDAQTLGSIKNSIEKADLENLPDRKQTETIQEALFKIFKTTDPDIALRSLDNVNIDYNQILLWLDANLPKEYKKPEDLYRAYLHMSKADVYSRRIRRWQHWRFMVYIFALISAGVATAKDEKYKGMVDFTETKRLLKIWMSNQKFAKRKAISEKIAKKTHTSVKNAIKDTFPYIKNIYLKNKTMAEGITSYLELSDDEVTWLRK